MEEKGHGSGDDDAAPPRKSVSRTDCRQNAVPSGSVPYDAEDEAAQSSAGDEELDHISPSSRRSLQEETHSLYHLLTHKPKNPYVSLAGEQL